MRTIRSIAILAVGLAFACSPSSSSGDPRANAREITELPEGTTFYLNDERGSPVVALDREGNVVKERSYHAYGAEREPASPQEPWTFAGNELDATELGNFHARPYDARLGRFLAVDPAPLFNPNAQLNPIAFQAYSYAAGDPVNLEDPTGRSVWTKLFKFGVRLAKTGDVAQSIYGMFEDAVTLFDASASVTDRVIAGVSLASEVAPISLGDVKDAGKALGTLAGAGKKTEKAANAARTPGRARAQERLRQIADDPGTASSDRGWIKQEINSIERGKRTNIRNPPGKQLAHSRGREAAKGYDHVESQSQLQDVDLHRTQHKFDDFGRANKERP